MATTAETTPPPVLDLSTERTRPTVKIDGRPYELRTSNDLTLANIRYLERVGPRLVYLESLPEMSAAAEVEYSGILARVLELGLVDVPAAVVEALGIGNRLAVARVFFELSMNGLTRMRAIATAQAIAATAKPSSGARPSRGSKGSTAARSSTGSRRSRRAR